MSYQNVEFVLLGGIKSFIGRFKVIAVIVKFLLYWLYCDVIVPAFEVLEAAPELAVIRLAACDIFYVRNDTEAGKIRCVDPKNFFS